MNPIGIIHTHYKTKLDCPIQPLYAAGVEGRVEVFEQYAAGLKDVELFSHLYLLYRFDRADAIQLVRPTFLDDTPHGIYASRHPCRPNAIGLSIVRLLRRDGTVVENFRVQKVLAFRGLERTAVDVGEAGDIVALAGMSDATVADTLCDPSVT